MSYAVIELSGAQFLVSEGDKLKVNRLPEEEGKGFSLTPLLVSSDEGIRIGTPLVEGSSVRFRVLEHKKDKKIEVRRFKSKSRYRKHKGHRQPVSMVEVTRISTRKSGEGKELGSGILGLSSKETSELSPKEPSSGEFAAELPLESLKLSTRTKNALEKAGIKTVSELKKMSKKELLEIKGIGEKAVQEIFTDLKTDSR